MAINDQVRTDRGTVWDASERRDESLTDISATKLLGDNLPSSPSDGQVLRFNGTSGAWEHKAHGDIGDKVQFRSQSADEDKAWLEHDPSDLESAATKFRFTVGNVDHNAGPSQNVVYRWGSNQPAERGDDPSADGSNPHFSDVLETLWEPTAGNFDFERYFEAGSADGSTTFRMLSFQVSHDDVTDALGEVRGRNFKFRRNSSALQRVIVDMANEAVVGQGYEFHIEADGNALTDGGTLDSPNLELKGYFDSDATAGITATARVFTLRNEVSASGGHKLKFVDNSGGVPLTLDGEAQEVGINDVNPGGWPLSVVGNGSNCALFAQGTVIIANQLRAQGELSHEGSNLGFFSTSPTTQQGLTDNSGGTSDGTLEAVSGSGADAAINNNFAEIRAALAAYGLVS